MLGELEGVEDHKLWLRDRRERRRRGAQPARIQLTIDSWDKSGIRGRDEAWARAGATGTMGRAATWAQRAQGVAGKKPHGMCTYGDCQEPGTQAAMGCLEGKALRCGNCAWLACWGRSECQCKAPLLNRRGGKKKETKRRPPTQGEKVQQLVHAVRVWQAGGRPVYITVRQAAEGGGGICSG